VSDDRGFVTVWTVAITATMFFIIAFTLDAGRVVRANSDAYGAAAAAARRALSELNEEEHVLSGDVELVQADAEAAGRQYCQDRGYTCDVQVNPELLTADVTARDNDFDLHLPGVPVPVIEVHASAQAIQVAG
jgi:Flp pilus assembly protein TadG